MTDEQVREASEKRRQEFMRGRPEKTLLLSYEYSQVSKAELGKLTGVLFLKGYDIFTVAVVDQPEPIQLFDLSHLPQPEIDEIRKMIKERERDPK